jgi:hypothetical protein
MLARFALSRGKRASKKKLSQVLKDKKVIVLSAPANEQYPPSNTELDSGTSLEQLRSGFPIYV